jgi:hypothetical protein
LIVVARVFSVGPEILCNGWYEGKNQESSRSCVPSAPRFERSTHDDEPGANCDDPCLTKAGVSLHEGY